MLYRGKFVPSAYVNRTRLWSSYHTSCHIKCECWCKFVYQIVSKRQKAHSMATWCKHKRFQQAVKTVKNKLWLYSEEHKWPQICSNIAASVKSDVDGKAFGAATYLPTNVSQLDLSYRHQTVDEGHMDARITHRSRGMSHFQQMLI